MDQDMTTMVFWARISFLGGFSELLTDRRVNRWMERWIDGRMEGGRRDGHTDEKTPKTFFI